MKKVLLYLNVGTLSYEDLVAQIKSDPEEVTLMVIQPFERTCIETRGIKLSSETCPAVRIVGRSQSDSTTSVRYGQWMSYCNFNLNLLANEIRECNTKHQLLAIQSSTVIKINFKGRKVIQ